MPPALFYSSAFALHHFLVHIEINQVIDLRNVISLLTPTYYIISFDLF